MNSYFGNRESMAIKTDIGHELDLVISLSQIGRPYEKAHPYSPPIRPLRLRAAAPEEAHDEDEEEECPVCGQIDGMDNPCCPNYDPLNYKNCGYG